MFAVNGKREKDLEKKHLVSVHDLLPILVLWVEKRDGNAYMWIVD